MNFRLAAAVFLGLLSVTSLPVLADPCIWIPPGVKVLRGLFIYLEDPDKYNAVCNDATFHDNRYKPILGSWQFAYMSVPRTEEFRTRADFENALKKVAAKTGHPEIAHLPIVTHGMSQTNSQNVRLFEIYPERVIAGGVVHVSGGQLAGPDKPQTLKTPLFFMSSRRDYLEESIGPGFMSRRFGAQYCPVQKNGEHRYDNADLFAMPFYEQAIRQRLPLDWDPLSGPPTLRNIPDEEGWIGFGDETFKSPYQRMVPAGSYSGMKNNPFWVSSEYVANLLRAFNTTATQINLTSPSIGMHPVQVEYGQAVTITATASGTGIKSVTLLDGDIPLKSFTAGPYTTTISDLGPGSHAISALLETTDGSRQMSRVAAVHVANTTGIFFHLKSPLPSARLALGASLPLQAKAVASSGSITEVEYFVDGASVGKAAADPYTVSWTPKAAGEFWITSLAKASTGKSVTTWPVKVTVLPQAPAAASIQVWPRSGHLRPGGKLQFRAEVRDQYGWKTVPQPSATFSVAGGGSIDANGLYTAPDAPVKGPITITAQSGGLSVKAALAVTTTIKVKFQPAHAVAPEGYLLDVGEVFGAREGGLQYGWNQSPRYSRSLRVDSLVPLEYQSFHRMRVPKNPPYDKSWMDFRWEVAVPNGEYMVRLGVGDASHYFDIGQGLSNEALINAEFRLKFYVDSVLMVDSIGRLDKPTLEVTKKVAVTDGRLTLRNGHEGPGQGLTYPLQQTVSPVAFIEVTPLADFDPSSIGKAEAGAKAREGRFRLSGAGISFTGEARTSLRVLSLKGALVHEAATDGSGSAFIARGAVQKGLYLVVAEKGGLRQQRLWTVP